MWRTGEPAFYCSFLTPKCSSSGDPSLDTQMPKCSPVQPGSRCHSGHPKKRSNSLESLTATEAIPSLRHLSPSDELHPPHTSHSSTSTFLSQPHLWLSLPNTLSSLGYSLFLIFTLLPSFFLCLQTCSFYSLLFIPFSLFVWQWFPLLLVPHPHPNFYTLPFLYT